MSDFGFHSYLYFRISLHFLYTLKYKNSLEEGDEDRNKVSEDGKEEGRKGGVREEGKGEGGRKEINHA